MKLDETIVFRWNADYAKAMRNLAERKGVGFSSLLRALLDSYLIRLGLISSHNPKTTKQ